MEKFDRQVRLWGQDGQLLLESSNVCIIGDESMLLQEVLKNLILPGILKISWVQMQELQLGKCKDLFFQDTLTDLKSLNSGNVHINIFTWKEVKETFKWSQFGVMIITNCSDKVVVKYFDEVYKGILPPIVLAYANGLFGYTHTVLYEPHFILKPHREYMKSDLRLDRSWKQLDDFMDSFDFDTMDNISLSELPYTVLIYKSISNIKDKSKITIDILKKHLMKYYISKNQNAVNDMNYLESIRYLYLTFYDKSLEKNCLEMINCTNIIENKSLNWNDGFNYNICKLLNILKSYMLNHDLPLCGEIPDMESDTQIYNKLKSIYKEKADEDCKIVNNMVVANKLNISKDLIRCFCKNIRYMTCIKPSKRKIHCIFDSSDLLLRDLLELQYGSVLNIELDENFKSALLVNPYPTSALIGGIVAQEAIKLLTHQYIPIDNTLVYDGLKNTMKTFEI